MFAQLRQFYLMLTARQRQRLLRLQSLVLLMAFAEIAGVVSIGPFMALVGDISQLQGDGLLADLYRQSGLDEPREFLIALGVFVLIMLSFATVISIFTTWRFAMYGNRIGAELSTRLFEHYMYQSWLFHTHNSSSDLTNKIMQECGRVTQNIVIPLLKMNARLVVAVSMAATILWFDPVVALSGLVIFVLAYLVIYQMVRRKLSANGAQVSRMQKARFNLLSNGLGAIRDVLLLGRQKLFVDRFREASNNLAQSLGSNAALAQVPGYALELVAFGSVILLVIYLLIVHEGDLGAMLPLLSVYALAGFKMLPAFQQVYSGLSQVRANLAAFEGIETDLKASVSTHASVSTELRQEARNLKISPRVNVKLDEVEFTYPNKADPALRGVSIDIPAKGLVGLVGASGSGKSTAIDILIGLLKPDGGNLRIDGDIIDAEKYSLWQNSIGFVPQQVFLAQASIRENIAFGISPEKIDDNLVQRAVELSHLSETVSRLPEGIDTYVGERGVQLSGGQQQRVGIARALYHDPDVLVLDEATSALDGISERAIMGAILDFSGEKTIIMIAHRLSTVKQCDIIYLVDEGCVVDQGSYDELIRTNRIFRDMT